MEVKKEVLSVESLPQETPSHHELLSIVRKHSSHLKDIAANEFEEGDLDMRFWRELLDMFFVRGKLKLKDSQDDDMVFFVHNKRSIDPSNEFIDVQPYFVRRWAPQLGKVIGESAAEVDWCRSLFLNLIAHTSYTVTVAICRWEALKNRTTTPQEPLYKVSKTVYASPSRVNFQKNISKGLETIPAYPDICFTVDDYDDTFEDVILKEPDHCYCVLLNAVGGAAFSPEDFQRGHKRFSMANHVLGEPHNVDTPKLNLFSGFVSYQDVLSAFEGGKSKIGLLLLGSSSSRSEHVVLQGPGGRGEIQVCVSGLPDNHSTTHASQENVHQGPFSLKSRSAAKIGTIMRKAAASAALAAKHAYAGSNSSKMEMEPLQLRCCLMSISLPWDVLAYDLLFKDLPDENR